MAVTTALRRVGGPLLGVVVFAVALAAWELWAKTAGSFLVPALSDVLENAWDVWPTTAFLDDVGQSLKRLAAGLVLGSVVGIAIGLLMGSSPAIRRALDPLVELARAIPAIAIVPALIVVFGSGDGMRIAVIA